MTERKSSDTAVGGGEEEVLIHTSNTSESGFDGAVDEVANGTGKHAGGNPTNQTTATRRSNHTVRLSNGGPLSSLSQASLGREIEGLVLFDLTTRKGASNVFSPHCIKTVLGLKLLGIGYDRQKLTFTEVRTNLASRVGENVTVPTLELADGSHLTDSWVIAQYLYEKHPKGSLLFPSSSSSSSSSPPLPLGGNASMPFARMVESFGKFSLAPNLGPLTRVDVYESLDAESKAYFENVKVGKTKMDKFRALSREERGKLIEANIAALEPINAALVVAREQSSARQTWLEASSHPTHADFVLYGWYVYTRVAGSSLTKQIWHAHPAVARWVKDMDDWAGPDITRDYF